MIGLVLTDWAPISAAAANETPLSPNPFSWGFLANATDAISSDGTHVWVADSYGDAMTELTGTLVQALCGSSYQFDSLKAISLEGT